MCACVRECAHVCVCVCVLDAHMRMNMHEFVSVGGGGVGCLCVCVCVCVHARMCLECNFKQKFEEQGGPLDSLLDTTFVYCNPNLLYVMQILCVMKSCNFDSHKLWYPSRQTETNF